MELEQFKWFGLLQICKPKKEAKIGIPIKPWHHLAFIDDKVIVYVWNTREILNVYDAKFLKPFRTVEIQDNFKPLILHPKLDEASITDLSTLMRKYPLPIKTELNSSELNLDSIADLRKLVSEQEEALQESLQPEIMTASDDLRILRFHKHMHEPINMYCKQKMLGANVLGDMTLTTGRRQLYLQHARIWTIKNIIQPNLLQAKQ